MPVKAKSRFLKCVIPRLVFCFIYLSYGNCLLADSNTLQLQKLDSLKQAYQTAQDDSLRCVLLSELLDKEVSDSMLQVYLADIKTILWRNWKPELNTNRKIFYASRFAEYFHTLAIIANVEGRAHEAVINFEKAIVLRKILNEEKLLAESYNSIGVVYKNMADYKMALNYYSKSLAIRKKLGDKKSLATSLNNLARIYESLGDFDASEKGYLEALQLAREANDEDGVALMYNNLGYTCKNRKQYERALNYYHASLEIRVKTENRKGQAMTLNNIGSVHEVCKNYDSALFYFQKSNALYAASKEAIGYATSLNNISNVFFRKGDLGKAIQFNQLSRQRGEEMKNPDVIRRAANVGYEIGLKKKDYKMALENYYLAITMRDSINNMQNQKLAMRQEMQNDFEKKKAISDAEHKAQLLRQEEKAEEERKLQQRTLWAIVSILLIVLVFSILMYNRFKITQKQKKVIELQKHLVEEKQSEILDSIRYARRIQTALVTSEYYVNKNLMRLKDDERKL